MKTEETYIKKISSGEFQVANLIRINLTATIENENLKQVKVYCQNLNFSEAFTQLTLVPENLCKEFEATEYSWEYLEKLAKFLNEVLKLRKK